MTVGHITMNPSVWSAFDSLSRQNLRPARFTMPDPPSYQPTRLLPLVVATAIVSLSVGAAHAKVLIVKNGMEVSGAVSELSSLGNSVLASAGNAGQGGPKLINFVDNQLQRIFVSTYQTANIRNELPMLSRIELEQRVALKGFSIGKIGSILKVTPFDKYGHRTFSMMSNQGRLDVIQGITRITPHWTSIEGLASKQKTYIWDMRIATSSLPRDVLNPILMHQIDPTNSDQRLNVVRLYIESQRYTDAETELQKVLQDFPKLGDHKDLLVDIRQLKAKRYIEEIRLRRQAGQFNWARLLLEQFPEDNVASELLLEVRDLLGEYTKVDGDAAQVGKLLTSHISEMEDGLRKNSLQAISAEIRGQLNYHNINRMADYLRLADDDNLLVEQKLALAVSGWFLGSGAADENPAVALSLAKVRDLVREYLLEKKLPRREELLGQLSSLEGATPNNVAKLLAAMRPPMGDQTLEEIEADEPVREPPVDTTPVDDPAPQTAPPGLLVLSAPGLSEIGPLKYTIQLPPEYDPYRKYPTIVTLHSEVTNPELQIDWWSGSYSDEKQQRLGQATRHGYIVVAPHWGVPHQSRYQFSAREHAAVLGSLSDAMRRFSIDSDRVFLSGHSMGGDAAWDIGLAHPDLWAGVIPIVATSDYGERRSPRYIPKYWRNAREVPLYFVAGELDGDLMNRNSASLDRYLTLSGFDCMVVEYRGRGHEHFQDEIQQIFTWIRLHRRDFYPRQFEVSTMRKWDNFFWWTEVDVPSKKTVAPTAWPPPRGFRGDTIEAAVRPDGSLFVKTAAKSATVWLTPEFVDFDRAIEIKFNGRKKRIEIKPSLETMLEDARTRADRMHPFWAKITFGQN
jgi:predicted esterase